MIVAKFGGSSVADANQFRKVKGIVNQDVNRNAVVVSAIGKGESDPYKLTDQLIKIYRLKEANRNYQEVLSQIRKRLLRIKIELNLSYPIENDFERISKMIPKLNYAELVSRGEYLTAHLMADYLGFQMLDTSDFLFFENHQINYQKSKSKLLKLMQNNSVVIPGFYGINEFNQVELMPRGGGDTSGAVIANLLDADKYENWTDIAGLRKADPRIIPDAQKINVITYDELRALAYMGVSAFQDEAIQPVKEKKIPIEILNTNHPEEEGTLIVQRESNQELNQLAGIAGKKNYTLINLRKYQLNNDTSLVIKLMLFMKKIKINYSYVPSGNDEISLLLPHVSEIDEKDLAEQLKKLIDPEDIIVKSNIALIGVVSEKFRTQPTIAGKVIELLADSEIPVNVIMQGSDDIKITFGVNDMDYQRAIQRLYRCIDQNQMKVRSF